MDAKSEYLKLFCDRNLPLAIIARTQRVYKINLNFLERALLLRTFPYQYCTYLEGLTFKKKLGKPKLIQARNMYKVEKGWIGTHHKTKLAIRVERNQK